MDFVLQPWQLFFMILAVWVNREQPKRLEFYQEQRKAMMKAQGKPQLAPDQANKMEITES